MKSGTFDERANGNSLAEGRKQPVKSYFEGVFDKNLRLMTLIVAVLGEVQISRQDLFLTFVRCTRRLPTFQPNRLAFVPGRSLAPSDLRFAGLWICDLV